MGHFPSPSKGPATLGSADFLHPKSFFNSLLTISGMGDDAVRRCLSGYVTCLSRGTFPIRMSVEYARTLTSMLGGIGAYLESIKIAIPQVIAVGWIILTHKHKCVPMLSFPFWMRNYE